MLQRPNVISDIVQVYFNILPCQQIRPLNHTDGFRNAYILHVEYLRRTKVHRPPTPPPPLPNATVARAPRQGCVMSETAAGNLERIAAGAPGRPSCGSEGPGLRAGGGQAVRRRGRRARRGGVGRGHASLLRSSQGLLYSSRRGGGGLRSAPKANVQVGPAVGERGRTRRARGHRRGHRSGHRFARRWGRAEQTSCQACGPVTQTPIQTAEQACAAGARTCPRASPPVRARAGSSPSRSPPDRSAAASDLDKGRALILPHPILVYVDNPYRDSK
jgi:hypothetical protein